MNNALIDQRLGLIRKLTPVATPPSYPAAFVAYSADVADTRRIGPWQAERVTVGAAFYDHEQARGAALGAALERYCGNWIPHQLERASYAELHAVGRPAIDPQNLALYVPAQYAQANFPFVPFTPELPVRWVMGCDMASGEPVLVPASLVYVNFYSGVYRGEPPTNFVSYSGIAACLSPAAAAEAALSELIEHDATVIWWMGGGPVRRLDPVAQPGLAAALTSAERETVLRFTLFPIPNRFGVSVMGALLEDRAQQLLAFGCACREEPQAAAAKALAETLQLQLYSEELLAPETYHMLRDGTVDPRAYKPYRSDRRYRDSYRADWRDLTDFGMHTQLFLDPRMRELVGRLTDGEPAASWSFDELHARAPQHTLLQRLAAQGLRAIAVDLTTSDVRAAGWSVVRVLVPGLYAHAPAAFPLLGGRRLYEEPAALGWAQEPLDLAQLERIPLPYA